jgi:hypothetical protein
MKELLGLFESQLLTEAFTACPHSFEKISYSSVSIGLAKWVDEQNSR